MRRRKQQPTQPELILTIGPLCYAWAELDRSALLQARWYLDELIKLHKPLPERVELP